MLNDISQCFDGVFCWFCVNVKYGRSASSTSAGNVGGNVNSVWQLLSHTLRGATPNSCLSLISGLGTKEWNVVKMLPDDVCYAVCECGLPMSVSLKNVKMFAWFLASTFGSLDDSNCVSCASIFAGFSDEISSIFHPSHWPDDVCGVAGARNNDGLHTRTHNTNR